VPEKVFQKASRKKAQGGQNFFQTNKHQMVYPTYQTPKKNFREIRGEDLGGLGWIASTSGVRPPKVEPRGGKKEGGRKKGRRKYGSANLAQNPGAEGNQRG